MTNWTPAQRAAIEDRGGGLLVSAAAGSGKTAVLTERAVRLITDPARPVDADRLLIVTFTNAAAAELRARIGESLLRLSQADPANGWLRRQRMLLQRAPICTIDAFCLDLLRRHFEELDIPPDFAPADAGSVQMLREAALADTLEAACQDPRLLRLCRPVRQGAAATTRRAGPCCRSTISSARCPITAKRWTGCWPPGSRWAALGRPPGGPCCWSRRPGGPGRPAACWKAPWPTARPTWPRSGSGPRRAARPPRPGRPPPTKWRTSLPSRWSAWTRPWPCCAGWRPWPPAGPGDSSTTC